MPTSSRIAVSTATLTLVAALALPVPALAQDAPVPSSPPGTNTSAPPPVKTDTNDPDLKLKNGAKLAPPKVLDIVSVVESQGGEERRSDTTTSITISLQADILFPRDSPTLTPTAHSEIDAIASEIKKNDPNVVRVFGFTDNLGSYSHGLVLSKRRANSVYKELVSALDSSSGIEFQVRGYSEDYPIADNSTESGRKKNRRVEVTFPRGS
jgi:outer membrane protein OmpA-like peptidoglycan-associated protein